MATFNTHISPSKEFVNYKTGKSLAHREANHPSFKEKQEKRRRIEDLITLRDMGLELGDIQE